MADVCQMAASTVDFLARFVKTIDVWTLLLLTAAELDVLSTKSASMVAASPIIALTANFEAKTAKITDASRDLQRAALEMFNAQ